MRLYIYLLRQTRMFPDEIWNTIKNFGVGRVCMSSPTRLSIKKLPKSLINNMPYSYELHFQVFLPSDDRKNYPYGIYIDPSIQNKIVNDLEKTSVKYIIYGQNFDFLAKYSYQMQCKSYSGLIPVGNNIFKFRDPSTLEEQKLGEGYVSLHLYLTQKRMQSRLRRLVRLMFIQNENQVSRK